MPLLYPIWDSLTPVPSSVRMRSLFPLDEEMSSKGEDPKECKDLLASDLWSHSQCGLSRLSQPFTVAMSLLTAPGF